MYPMLLIQQLTPPFLYDLNLKLRTALQRQFNRSRGCWWSEPSIWRTLFGFPKEFHKADAYATNIAIHDGQLSTKKRKIKIFTQSTRRIVPKGTIPCLGCKAGEFDLINNLRFCHRCPIGIVWLFNITSLSDPLSHSPQCAIISIPIPAKTISLIGHPWTSWWYFLEERTVSYWLR